MKCKECVHCKYEIGDRYGTCEFPGLNLDGMAQIGGMVNPYGFPAWCVGGFQKKVEKLTGSVPEEYED